MKKLLIILSGVLLIATTQGQTVVYTNLSPSNTYDQNNSRGIFNLQGWAMQFVPTGSGNLATVDLGLTYGDSPAPVDVYLYDNLAGPNPNLDKPDTATQMLLGTATAMAQYGTTNSSLVPVNVAGTVPVVSGTPYWLGLVPTSSDGQSWNQTLPVVNGFYAVTGDAGATWIPLGSDALAAFRVTVAEVPEAGGTVWGFLGIAGLVLVGRQRIIKRCNGGL